MQSQHRSPTPRRGRDAAVGTRDISRGPDAPTYGTAEIQQRLAKAVVPSFTEVFGRPSDYPPGSPMYEAYRASARAFHTRLFVYQERGVQMHPAELLKLIVRDVIGHLLFTEERKVWFFSVRHYSFFDSKKFPLRRPKAVEEAERQAAAFGRAIEKKISVRLAIMRGHAHAT